MTEETFLSRWSRRKSEARRVGTPDAAAPADPPAAPVGTEVRSPAPEPPSIDSLKGLAADYREFLKPGIDDALKRAALKKLFADPHFNVMDGLDVYIDDYTKGEPIPEEMLKRLAHVQDLLFKDEKEQAVAPSREGGESRTDPASANPARVSSEGPAAHEMPDPDAGKPE